MGLLDWFRRRKKKPKEEEAPPIDEEREALERTRKLQAEIEEHVEEEPKRAKRKKRKVGD
jgi:hypothetical protein